MDRTIEMAQQSIKQPQRRMGRRMARGRLFASSTDHAELPQSSHDLKRLLAAVATGDRTAFARLYQVTSPRLYALCLRITSRADLADDALQEGFVRIWRYAGDYDMSKGEPLAWITVVVRNRARSLAEKARKISAVSTSDDGLKELPDLDQQDALSHTMSQQNSTRVRACLTRLDEGKRQALLLVYFDGLTHQQLAQRLQVPLGTAKSWVRRGLEQMGKCLTDGTDQQLHEILAGEHELGALPLHVTPAFDRRREKDAKFCLAADWWQDQFVCFLDYLSPQMPPASVWAGIERELMVRPHMKEMRGQKWLPVLMVLTVLCALAFFVLLF